MLEEFLDSVLIVDDNYKEVVSLQKVLEAKDIWVTNRDDPETLKDIEIPLKVRKLLIVDLFLRNDKSLQENIGVIRQILTNVIGNCAGSYGILLWTKHDEQFNEFEQKVFKNNEKYTLPLFVVCLDKTKYLRSGNYETIFEDIEKKLLENKPAYFFMCLDQLIKKGKSTALHSFYDLAKESEFRNNDLVYLLNRIGVNYSGAPTHEPLKLETEVIRAFCDMLYYDVTSQGSSSIDLFDGTVTEYKGNHNSKKIAFANLNSKLHLDFDTVKTVFPGSVYQILEETELFALSSAPEEATKIVIEITPPCDFASGHRKSARLIGGFLTPYSNEKKKKLSKYPSLYTELSELHINGFENSQFMVFDFHYLGTLTEDQLKDETKFKCLMRVKNSLLADIIQKFSSYSSRLGIPTID
ncbi:hypothetical protein LVD13_11280 [Flavobacteriaceae bacterium D16]|nr:hypothetical protein [Flavobacteriaceae bacterium D16]